MVALTREEQRRKAVLDKVNRGEMSLAQAAKAMGLTQGYVRRLLAGYRDHGVQALAHGNRGRKRVRVL